MDLGDKYIYISMRKLLGRYSCFSHKSRFYIDKQSMFWDSKKSIERRRIVSVRKSKTGFADAYVKFS